MRIKLLRLFMASMVALVAMVAGIQPAKASLPPASFSVYPPEGTPGTIFFFSASSFRSERVGYWFNAPDGTIYANKYRYAAYAYDGQIAWRWQAPYDAQPGMWTAVAKGEESGLQQVIPFRVVSYGQATSATAPAPAEPTIAVPSAPAGTSVYPTVGPQGTNFTFTAEGLDGERAGYWFNAPNGSIMGDNVRYWFKSDQIPSTWSWKAPDNAMSGVWSVTVRGEESGIEYTIPFVLQRPPDAAPPETVPVNPPCLGAVEPQVGYPNTEFKFFVTGFPPRNLVRYWAEDPNGRKYDFEKEKAIGSNPDGRVDIAWSAPDEATPGYWKMYFLSDETGTNDSRIERIIYFEVRNPDEPLPPVGEYTPPPACQMGN